MPPAAAADSSHRSPIALRQARLLDGAEQRFHPPSEDWFHDTQAELRQNVAEVGAAFAAMDPNEAQAWKEHLRWHLLEPNLQSVSVNLAELELVHRWMYSNRKGLEGPLFADLRKSMDAFLDAAFTFSYTDLPAAYAEQVVCGSPAMPGAGRDPSDANAAASVGRWAGWSGPDSFPTRSPRFAHCCRCRTRRSSFRPPSSNACCNCLKPRSNRPFRSSSTETAPPSGILRRERTLHVSGTAHSVGSTTLEVIANAEEAELSLVFQGQVVAHCRANAGPATLNVRTAGPVEAFKPIFLSTDGLRVGDSEGRLPSPHQLAKRLGPQQFREACRRNGGPTNPRPARTCTPAPTAAPRNCSPKT